MPPDPHRLQQESSAPSPHSETLNCPEDVDWIFDADTLQTAGTEHLLHKYGLTEPSSDLPHHPFALGPGSAALWDRHIRRLSMASGEAHILISAFSKTENADLQFYCRVAGYREEGLPRIVANFQKIDAASQEASNDTRHHNWLYLLHEIKNPLSLLQAAERMELGTQQEGMSDSDYARLRRYAVRCLEEHLRNGVFLATDQDSPIPNRREPVDLRLFLEEFRESFQPLLDLQQNELEMNLQIESLRQVRMDRALLSQLLNNLLLNKLNILHHQKVWFNVEALHRHTDRTGPSILFTIEDNGPPFPASVLEGLERSADMEALFRLQHGAGLGLGICRRIVSSMNGTLRFYNDPPKTRIRLSLPVD